MAKKRRRKKKKRSAVDGEFFGGEEDRPPAKGMDFIDEHVIRLARSFGLRITRSLFKDAGFRCTTCMWTTSKTGTNGRNAMRAHLKKHLNTRRALNRLRPYVYLGLLLVLSALVLSFRSDLDIGAAWSLVEGVDWAVMAGPSLLAFSIAAVAGLGTFEYLFRKRPTKRWWLGFRVSVVCALAVLASEVVLASGAATSACRLAMAPQRASSHACPVRDASRLWPDHSPRLAQATQAAQLHQEVQVDYRCR